MSEGQALQRWGDGHQYVSEPMPTVGGGPRVYLLNATPDPLGSVAALCAMYEGRVVRDLSSVTHEERWQAFESMTKTALSGALEGAQFHFLIEGVDRAFTHQLVRGRHAFYAQESLRFAVKEDWAAEISLPPYLAGLAEDDVRVRVWRKALNASEDAYGALVAHGVPAEEARKLLPHAVLTRVHWVCSLRELLNVAGLRTCTQAEFGWRLVMAQIAVALRAYGRRQPRWQAERLDGEGWVGVSDDWQFEFIADKLRPVCYQTGRCGFMAAFDRSCSIRSRVEANAKIGRPSSEWGETSTRLGNPGQKYDHRGQEIALAIHDEEWAVDPSAARKPVV